MLSSLCLFPQRSPQPGGSDRQQPLSAAASRMADVMQICQLLQTTCSGTSAARKEAEQRLAQVKVQPGFAPLLMQIVGNGQLDQAVRHSAVIYLKNLARNNWGPTADQLVPASDKAQVRAQMLALMLQSPPYARAVLEESVNLIAVHDFPREWPTLTDELVQRLGEAAQQGMQGAHGILATMHAVYQTYRDRTLDHQLKEELLPIIAKTGPPLLQMVQSFCQQLSPQQQDLKLLSDALKALETSVQVFYDLTALDLGPFFEDNVGAFMQCFQQVLQFEHPQLTAASGDTEEGPLETAKARVIEAITRFLQQYDDDIRTYVQGFATQTWQLLTQVTPAPRYDDLAIAALELLGAVGSSIHHGIFQDPQVIHTVCEKIIIPNMRIRQSDAEMFSEDCEEYIKRDIEGSDQLTRRRAACALINALCKNYQANVQSIFQTFVGQLVASYQQNPAGNWADKDCAIYLLTALSTKQGVAAVARHGVSAGDSLVNIGEFFGVHILPDLQAQSDTPQQVQGPAAIIKADCIKFVCTFRRQIPPEQYPACISVLAKWLLAKEDVVVTYAASTIERLLAMTLPQAPGAPPQPFVTKDQMAAMAGALFTNLFKALQEGDRENPYTMQCLMRVIRSAQEHVGPFIAPVLDTLLGFIAKVAKNPVNPQYNHYLFEAVSALIKYNPAQVAMLEQKLWPTFAGILQADVSEFMPYVFQLFAQMLEVRPAGDVPGCYQQLLPVLCSPELIKRKGNIPAVARLLAVFITKGAATQHVEQILGMFQQLCASKTMDHEGFNLLNDLLQSIPYQTMQQYMTTVFQLVFGRLTQSKTVKFMKMVVVFCSIFIVHQGADELIRVVNGVQDNIFGMLYNNVIHCTAPKVSSPLTRKCTVVALTRLCCESQVFPTRYPAEWAKCVTLTLAMATGAPVDQSGEGNLFEVAALEASALGTKYEEEWSNSYCPLQAAVREEQDYCKHVPMASLQEYFRSQWVGSWVKGQPQLLLHIKQTGVSPEQLAWLQIH